jgi:hypothetical protein
MLFQLQTKVVMVSAFLLPAHSFRLIGFSSFQHAWVLQFDELWYKSRRTKGRGAYELGSAFDFLTIGIWNICVIGLHM